MSQLMKTLFELLSSPNATEMERQAIRGSEKAVQAAEARLTREEFENFWDAVRSIENAGCLDSFALGFRLGVQLTMEGMRPIVE